MKKDITEQEAYLQLAALCAQAEHCQQEMRDKMRRWELDETVQNRIIDRLIKERYVDDERYARAFVKDKIRYNKWGRRKVQQGLGQKRINADIQQRVLDEIEEKEYLDILRPPLKPKRKSTTAERALRFQSLGGILGDGAIEKQRVIVRHEECQMRLVLQNITFHR